jgi:hypothetical protein
MKATTDVTTAPGDSTMQYANSTASSVHPLPALSAAGALGVLAKLGASPGYELRFESLFHSGRALAFPCDAQGQVALDSLSETARRNYFYARTVIGREFATPAVVLALRN